MRSGVFLLWILVWALSTSAPAAAQTDDPEAPVVPVVMSISGGVSRGAYQAGVNWALIEVLKLTRRAEIREAWHLPRYELEAMAGASAGGINGFLTAIEWCGSREPVPADESLFWHIWLRTGFDQLLPPDGGDISEPSGVLSRRYFDEVLLPALAAKMERPAGASDCRIPIGVTASRLRPASVEVAPDLTAVTQRYASVVEVRRAARTLVFGPFTPAATDPAARRRLGELLLLPESGGLIRDEDVFRLVKASSAFPGAFAPVEVRFQGSCDGGVACTDSAYFSDGGLFDNSPIALAAGIHAVGRPAAEPRPDSSALLVHIDSDRLRGRLRDSVEVRRENEQRVRYRGIGALLQLAAGAVPSARQYELTSFARLIAWAPDVFVKENILPTTRAFPIMGDQLAGFGAFLGRPFREADFYAGVYDALHFFAREACGRPGAAAGGRACVAGRLRTLVESDELLYTGGASESAESRGRRAVRWLYRWEFGPPPERRLSVGPESDPDGELLARLVEVSTALVRSGRDLDCGGNLVESLLCENAFRAMLDAYATPGVLAAIDASIAARPADACSPERWLSSPDSCYADESFRAFVRDPERFLSGGLERMLHRVWRVEATTEEAGTGPAFESIATVAEVVFQSTVGARYRTGFELNASSLPRGVGTLVSAIVPNYLSLNLGSVGFEIGYRPMLHLSSNLAIGVTGAPFHLIDNPIDDRKSVWGGGGPHLHWKVDRLVVTGLAGGVERLYRWGGAAEAGETDRQLALTVTAYLIAGKIRLSARIMPGNDSELYSGSDVGVSIGISDVNGLAYWVFR